MPIHLTPLERSFLDACVELVRREAELLPLLGGTLGVPAAEIFQYWMKRDFPSVKWSEEDGRGLQTGRITGTDWAYFFHGMECDIRNRRDGRYVRVEFGPRGRVDTLSEYAVLQFVMTSRSPWREFPDLREYLADGPPPYDENSGSHDRMSALWDRMEEGGFVESAAPDLQALVKANTATLPDGMVHWALPNDLPEDVLLDCCVSGRSVLTDLARRTVMEEKPLPQKR